MSADSSSASGQASMATGKHNATAIFFNALETCVKTYRIYGSTDPSKCETARRNVLLALSAALGSDTTLSVVIKPDSFQYKDKIVYTNDNERTSLVHPLYSDGIRHITFTNRITEATLPQLIRVWTTDYSLPESNELDTYCLIQMELADLVWIYGFDTFSKTMQDTREFLLEFESFKSTVFRRSKTAPFGRERSYRPSDRKTLTEVSYLDCAPPPEPDSAAIEKLKTQTPATQKIKLAKLASMVINLASQTRDVAHLEAIQNLVLSTLKVLLQEAQVDLLARSMTTLDTLAQTNRETAPLYQAIFASFFDPNDIGRFRTAMNLMISTGQQQLFFSMLTHAPESAFELLWALTLSSSEAIQPLLPWLDRHLSARIPFLVEELKQNLDNPIWRELFAHWTRSKTDANRATAVGLCRAIVKHDPPNLRDAIFDWMATQNDPELVPIIESYFQHSSERARARAYAIAPRYRCKPMAKALRNLVENEKFGSLPEQEQSLIFLAAVALLGKAGKPWFVTMLSQTSSVSDRISEITGVSWITSKLKFKSPGFNHVGLFRALVIYDPMLADEVIAELKTKNISSKNFISSLELIKNKPET